MARQTIDEIILEIEKLQSAIEEEMAGSLSEIFKDLSQQVIEISDGISLTGESRAKSLIQLINLKSQIASVIVSNKQYQGAVKKVIDSFSDLANLTDKYFGLVIDSYQPDKKLYNAIVKAASQATKDALIGGAMKDNFGNAISAVLKANLTGSSDRKQLNKALRTFIAGDKSQKPFLERYIKQVTNDVVMAFNNQYMQAVSADLDLQHYVYQGTLIVDSRPFCVARAGRYFTKDEVESWASLDWTGKMAGTNSVTIFSYRGGYNCRHNIYPVSKEQYEDRANRQGLKPVPKKEK
jgi:hypothetical protein